MSAFIRDPNTLYERLRLLVRPLDRLLFFRGTQAAFTVLGIGIVTRQYDRCTMIVILELADVISPLRAVRYSIRQSDS